MILAQLGTTLGQAVVTFIASLIVGTVATYVATSTLLDESGIVHSFVTALIASLVWVGITYVTSGTSFALVPFVGPILALVAYVVVIDLRYPGTLVRATGISVLTWGIDFVILYVLALLGVSSFALVGIPPGI